MESNIVYKIRRKADGLFSTGGTTPSFTEKGKVWRSRKDISLHIGMLLGYNLAIRNYEGCEIVAYETKEFSSESAIEWMDDISNKRNQRKEEQEEISERNKEANRRRQYQELKAEFEHGITY